MVVNFSDRLREALAESGLKSPKSALAAHTGVHLPAVSRWLNGSIPKAETLEKIAEFLNVDVKWLLTGIRTYHAPPSPTVGEDPSVYGAKIRRGSETLEQSQSRIADALERIANAMESRPGSDGAT